jgi:hypothetical protein
MIDATTLAVGRLTTELCRLPREIAEIVCGTCLPAVWAMSSPSISTVMRSMERPIPEPKIRLAVDNT